MSLYDYHRINWRTLWPATAELFFTVRLIVPAWKQTTAPNSALYCDMVSISVHSNVFIVFFMTVAVSRSEGDSVTNWKGSVRNLVWPNRRYCLPVFLREAIQAHHNIRCPGTSSEATSSSAGRETPHILWNMVIHSCVHKSPLLFPMLSQMKPVHALPAYLFKIHYKMVQLWVWWWVKAMWQQQQQHQCTYHNANEQACKHCCV